MTEMLNISGIDKSVIIEEEPNISGFNLLFCEPGRFNDFKCNVSYLSTLKSDIESNEGRYWFYLRDNNWEFRTIDY